MFKKAVPLGMVLAFAGCGNLDGVTDGQAENAGSSKPPLEFDEASILVPPDLNSIRDRFRSRVTEDQTAPKALPKAAANYYTFGMHTGMNTNDYQAVYNKFGNAHCPGDHDYRYPAFWYCPQNTFIQATYSSRFTSNQDGMWLGIGIPQGPGLQSAYLADNEQVEMHFTWDMRGMKDFQVTVKYEVGSEANYDYLWINSTGSSGTCNSPGVVRKKVSGVEANTISFTIPSSCGTGWVGIYYIKDGSLSRNGDFVRIHNVEIAQSLF
jgi:hypothetical protein